MVRTLHRAGIEVILDVVYNHTAEGNHLGPTLSFRGIDNAGLLPARRRATSSYYYDTTGTGNSFNVRHHESLRLIMDSLRYWVIEMHVDGFRFDLASALAREFHEVDRLAAFFDLVNQDPVVSQVKLIAEPWDVGEGGYQVGGFPPLWTEWNGKYRDTVRDFWRGEPASLGRVRVPVHRLVGPVRGRQPPPHRLDQLRHRARRVHPRTTWSRTTTSTTRPTARTTATGRATTGRGTTASEGPTDDAEVAGAARAAEAQLPRHAAAVPGRADDRRTATSWAAPSSGNNNVYCQDNELSWVDWDGGPRQRRAHRVHRASWPRCAPRTRSSGGSRFFQGRPIQGSSIDDIAWLRPDGAAR